MLTCKLVDGCDDGDDDDDVSGIQRYTKWSQCSKTTLDESLTRGLGICLDNVPDTYISAQCGNGIVDDGEECDCGLAPNAEVISPLSACYISFEDSNIT